MINLRKINEEIRKIRECGNAYEDMERLGWLYLVRKHMMEETHEEREEENEERLTMEEACAWVRGMKGTDPQTRSGGKWTMEEAWKLARKMGMSGDGDDMVEFFAVLNAMYADYYEVAKKYEVAKPEFFADMACAWLNDEDAVEGKAKEYFEHVVK